MSQNVAILSTSSSYKSNEADDESSKARRVFLQHHPFISMAPVQGPELQLTSFPIELLSYIFSLACTDDGATVHSLSLASRLFRSIACPLLYDTLSLHTSTQITHLSNLLPTLPPHLRFIRHLYVHLSPPQARLDVSSDLQNLFSILSLASSTLESLTFVYPNTALSLSIFARVFRIPFPKLRELTLHGFYPFPNALTVYMPKLERLHLSGNRNPYGLFHPGCLTTSRDHHTEGTCVTSDTPKEERGFPSLTHLKISGVSMACAFAMELEQVVQCSREVEHESKYLTPTTVGNGDDGRLSQNLTHLQQFTLQLPSKLEHIVVQPVFSTSYSLSVSNGKGDTHVRSSMSTTINEKKNLVMMERLRNVVRSQDEWVRQHHEKGGKTDGDSSSDALYVTLDEKSAGLEGVEEKVYRDWRERLEGGKGCWSLK